MKESMTNLWCPFASCTVQALFWLWFVSQVAAQGHWQVTAVGVLMALINLLSLRDLYKKATEWVP